MSYKTAANNNPPVNPLQIVERPTVWVLYHLLLDSSRKACLAAEITDLGYVIRDNNSVIAIIRGTPEEIKKFMMLYYLNGLGADDPDAACLWCNYLSFYGGLQWKYISKHAHINKITMIQLRLGRSVHPKTKKKMMDFVTAFLNRAP